MLDICVLGLWEERVQPGSLLRAWGGTAHWDETEGRLSVLAGWVWGAREPSLLTQFSPPPLFTQGPEFVRKHIFNKHAEKIEEVKKEVAFFNNFLTDAKRPALPEIKPAQPPGPAQSKIRSMRVCPIPSPLTVERLLVLFMYLFLAALGLRCCARAFSSCGELGLLFVAVRRLPIHCGGFFCCGAWALGTRASVVVAHGLH